MRSILDKDNLSKELKMKKLFGLLLLVILLGTGYYFVFGSAKITKELKTRVDTQLRILQANGFSIDDRKAEQKKEHFVVTYTDPQKITRFLKSRNIAISDEEATMLKGLRVGVDLTYLQGTYSALSVDLYPISLPPALLQSEDRVDRESLEKLVREKVLVAHIDINKLFNAYRGTLKDINTTLKGKETLRLFSKDFAFAGSFDRKGLNSASNTIAELNISDSDGTALYLSGLDGTYTHTGGTLYDFTTQYGIETLKLRDGTSQSVTLRHFNLKTIGKEENRTVSSQNTLTITALAVNEHRQKHYFEGIDGHFLLENISVEALEKMQHVDPDDSEGFNQAFKLLLSKGITVKMDSLSVKKIKENNSGPIDGFTARSLLKIDKVTDFKSLEENPFLILSILDASVHIELSDALYLELRKRPEFTIATLFFSPVSKNQKQIYDLTYKDGSLKVNGRPLL